MPYGYGASSGLPFPNDAQVCRAPLLASHGAVASQSGAFHVWKEREMHERTHHRELTTCMNCIGYASIIRQYTNEAVTPLKPDRLLEFTTMIANVSDEWRKHVEEDDHATQ